MREGNSSLTPREADERIAELEAALFRAADCLEVAANRLTFVHTLLSRELRDDANRARQALER